MTDMGFVLGVLLGGAAAFVGTVYFGEFALPRATAAYIRARFAEYNFKRHLASCPVCQERRK